MVELMNYPSTYPLDRKKRSESIHYVIKALGSEIITEKQFNAISVGLLTHYIKEDMDRIVTESIKSAITELVAGKKRHAAY